MAQRSNPEFNPNQKLPRDVRDTVIKNLLVATARRVFQGAEQDDLSGKFDMKFDGKDWDIQLNRRFLDTSVHPPVNVEESARIMTYDGAFYFSRKEYGSAGSIVAADQFSNNNAAAERIELLINRPSDHKP